MSVAYRIKVAVGVTSVLVLAYVGLTVVLPLAMNPNLAEVCGRSYERSPGTISTTAAALVGADGPLRKVGESRRGATLYARWLAGPRGGCDGSVPTVLLSKVGAGWDTWSLKGGP